MLLRGLAAFLLCVVASSTAFAQHFITVEPTSVRANSNVSFVVKSPTGLDLSSVLAHQVLIHPNDGVGHFQVIPQSTGSLSVQFTLDDDASLGNRNLIIIFPNNLVVSQVFEVTRGLVACAADQFCCSHNHKGDCMRCQPRPCAPPSCPSGLRCCAVSNMNPSICSECRQFCRNPP